MGIGCGSEFPTSAMATPISTPSESITSDFIRLTASPRCSLSALHLNEDQQTARSRIREADAAHARNNPFLSAACGRYISNGESKQRFSF